MSFETTFVAGQAQLNPAKFLSPFAQNMVKALTLLRRPVTVGFIVFVLVLFLTQLLAYQRYMLVQDYRTRELTNAANVVKEKIESTLSRGMAAATALNIMVKNYGVGDFDSISQRILEINKNIDGLSLVEGETVTHIYPLKGNEVYLGHNIFTDTASNKEVRASLRRKEFYFAGPYILVQGGKGIIGREPIFIDGRYYGFATALIKLPTFLKVAELNSQHNPLYEFQLSKIDPGTHKEEFFLPHGKPFHKEGAVLVKIPGGNWNIYARFTKHLLIPPVYPLVILGILLASVAGLLGWYVARRPIDLKRLIAEKMKLLHESEVEYTSLFQQANDAILVIDLQGFIVDANDSLCKMLQYSKEDLLKMGTRDIADPEEQVRNPIDYDAILNGKLLLVDRSLVKSTGAIVETEMSLKKIADNKILIIGRDVTEQRKVQKQIALSESTLRSAFDYSSIGVCLVSIKGEFLKTNRKLSEMLGYTEEEFQTLDFKDIIYPADLESGLSPLTLTQKDQIGKSGNEKRYVCKDKSIIWINLVVSLVNGNNNEPLFYVCQIENITHVKRIARQLSERVKELQCLYGLSEVANRPGKSMEEIITEFIEQIPPAYQYPEITCARIIFNNKAFETNCFRDSIWKQQADILSGNLRVGSIEVFYTEEREPEAEGPFLREERYLITSIADILGNSAERKKAQSELKQSEEKFRSLVEQSLASIFIYQDNNFVYVNPAFERTSGYAEDQLINTIPFEDLVHPDDKMMIRDNYVSRLSGQAQADHYMLKLVRSDAAVCQIEMVVSTILYNDKLAIIGTIIDVTERMEEEKRIERAVTEAQEKERLQIGMELHDNVKQLLAASKFGLDVLASSLDEREEALRIVGDLRSNTVEAINELRRLSHQLAPSVDSSRSLADKIRSLAENMNASGALKIFVDVQESSGSLRDDVQLALYRILQEQLVNIIKYAEASLVEINITANYEGVLMKITDNGIGYDTNVKKVGIGLENIRRRARFLDGWVEIVSSPGMGCKMAVHIPLVSDVVGV